MIGYYITDSIAFVQLDNFDIESFELQDNRSTLKGDHVSKDVGRITDGSTERMYFAFLYRRTRAPLLDTIL